MKGRYFVLAPGCFGAQNQIEAAPLLAPHAPETRSSMHCPRCEQSTLDEREREGITVDVCRSCRGIWLDRGELEKLIARATRDLDEPSHAGSAPVYPPSPSAHGRGAPPPYRRDDTPPRGTPRYGEHASGHHYDPRKKKKHWLESFGDIFD